MHVGMKYKHAHIHKYIYIRKFPLKKHTTHAAMAAKEFVEVGLKQLLITILVSLDVQ